LDYINTESCCKGEIKRLFLWEKSLNVYHVTARRGDLAGMIRLLDRLNMWYASEQGLLIIPEELYRLDAMGCSTLYWACVSGNLDLVLLLLELNFDPIKVSGMQESLLHVACELGHFSIVNFVARNVKVTKLHILCLCCKTNLNFIVVVVQITVLCCFPWDSEVVHNTVLGATALAA
jgi:hypothetical protein